MKKRRVLLTAISLFALAITGCNFQNNESQSSFSSQISSNSEISTSSNETISSSINVSSSSEFNSTYSFDSSIDSSINVSSSSNSSTNSSSTASSSSSTQSSSVSSSSSTMSSSSSSSSSSVSSSSSTQSSSSSSSSSISNKKVTLDVFAFNDTHGNVSDTPGKGISLARTSTALKELTNNKNALLLSQGDMWQGSVESNYTRGNLVTEWMNSVGFDAMTMGNHEFDWGQEYITKNGQLAIFPMLGINILRRSDDKRVDYLDASTVVEKDGAKIGIIGAISNCYTSISGSLVEDIYFATGYALTELVKEESTRLRNEEKCDFVIYSLHGDSSEYGEYDDILSSDHYVDLVLEGHTHQKYARQDSYGVWHVQNRGSNQDIAQITIDLNLTNKQYSVTNISHLDFSASYSPYKNYSEDETMKALLAKYYDQYNIAYKELGIVSSFKNANDLRNKLSELYYQEGIDKWGSSYEVLLGGGYMSCRNSGIGPGMVTYGDVAECFPFDNEIVLCSIRGSDLERTQFITGSSYYYVTWSDESIKYNVEYFKTYYLVTDTYTSDYYSYLTIVDYLQLGRYARDLLADYISEGHWDETPVITDAHAGTLSDPKTIEEGRALGALYTDSNLSTPYFFKGIVSRLASSLGTSSNDMRSVYVRDADKDNEMQIYYLSKFDGANKYNGNWTSIYDLSLGDELIFNGRPFLYNSSILEFASGSWVYSINGVVTGPSY